MRYALIGCGRIAGRHLTAARAASLEVVAVCDPVLERGRELLRRTGWGSPAPESMRTTGSCWTASVRSWRLSPRKAASMPGWRSTVSMRGRM